MDNPTNPNEMTRGPVDALRTTLRNGINRYKALADAKESRTLLAAFFMSFVGLRFITVALVVLSYKLGDGALGVGAMLAIQMVPGIFFQPMAGSIVDRLTGKRLLVLCQIAMATCTFAFLLLLAFPSIWLLYGIVFIKGIVNTIDIPGLEVRIMALTPIEKRGTANAVQSLLITLAEVVGPLLGGLLLAVFGSGPVFAIAGLIYLTYGLIINRLPERVEGSTRLAEEGSEEEADEASASRDGYRGILRRPVVVLYILSVAASYLVVMGVVPLFIVRGLELGMTEASVGVFYAVMGLGGFFGGIFSGMGTYTTRQALAVTGLAAAGGALVTMVFGFIGIPIVAFALLALAGMLGELEEIPALTYFQNSLPESIYGRFFSLFLVVASIGGLIGSLLAPFLADRFSTEFALTTVAIPSIVFGLLLAIRGGGFTFSRSPFSMAALPGIVASPMVIPADGLATADESPIPPAQTDVEPAVHIQETSD